MAHLDMQCAGLKRVAKVIHDDLEKVGIMEQGYTTNLL